MTQLNELIQAIEAVYPLELAESWDQVGLHFGHPEARVEWILVSLDVRPNIVEEAIANQIDTIICHHPPIFKAIQRFVTTSPQIKMYEDLIKAGINVYAMHTNYDRAWQGMNDHLAKRLGLEQIQSLTPDEAEPSIGRLGYFPQALTRDAFLQRVKEAYQLQSMHVIEKHPKDSYKKIAIVGGSGMSFLDLISQLNVDAFITGDIKFHDGQDAFEENFMTIDAGHYIEVIFIEAMTEFLQNQAKQNNMTYQVIASKESSLPFEVY